MMPLFAFSLYDSLKYFKTNLSKPYPIRRLPLNAVLAGLMLYGKFPCWRSTLRGWEPWLFRS
jgi:hypothetical protein